MSPVAKPKPDATTNDNMVWVSVTGLVRSGTGGARKMGTNVLVCDFDLKETSLHDLEWKPFMELAVEIAVLPREDGTVLVFTRRRILEAI